MYLNLLFKYTPVIYYAVLQPPTLVAEQDLHPRILSILIKQFSLLEFHQGIREKYKQDFRGYAFAIIEKLCHRNKQNCIRVVTGINESFYMFKDIELVFQSLRRQLLEFK